MFNLTIKRQIFFQKPIVAINQTETLVEKP